MVVPLNAAQLFSSMCPTQHLCVVKCILCHTQGKWTVPLPKVKAVGENEVFKVVRTGKTKR